MQRAITLAALGRFTTAPNPNVGAVVVRDGVIVGEGYHQQAGGPHAEVFALRQAGELCRGATCYVTLEPCSHYGRTPPCALGLIEAGIVRVVVAMTDPNPVVAGRGIALLRAAGITVETGLLEAAAEALNPGFLTKMRTGRPFVRLKLAASLDGAVALANGDSKWLTGAAAREDVQLFRAQSCAVLSTAETVLQDHALLNVRSEHVTPRNDGSLRQPLRVILDSRGRLQGDEPIFSQAGDILLIRQPGLALLPLLSMRADETACQVNYTELGLDPQQRFALIDILALLSALAVHMLWVEAGGTLAGEFYRQQLIDELVIYQAPMLLGVGSKPMLPIGPLHSLTDAPRWRWHDVTLIGDDLRLCARLKGPE